MWLYRDFLQISYYRSVADYRATHTSFGLRALAAAYALAQSHLSYYCRVPSKHRVPYDIQYEQREDKIGETFGSPLYFFRLRTFRTAQVPTLQPFGSTQGSTIVLFES